MYHSAAREIKDAARADTQRHCDKVYSRGAWKVVYGGVRRMTKKTKLQTNADWVRSLSDKELCDVIINCCTSNALGSCFPSDDCIGDCGSCVLEWLKQEHKEEYHEHS